MHAVRVTRTVVTSNVLYSQNSETPEEAIAAVREYVRKNSDVTSFGVRSVSYDFEVIDEEDLEFGEGN